MSCIGGYLQMLLNVKGYFHDEELDEPPCCDNKRLIINDDALEVCVNCGTVYGRQLLNHEKRAYTFEEVNQRRRTEPRWRAFGPRTIIGSYHSDHQGAPLPVGKVQFYNRLNKIQNSLVNSFERNLWESKPKLQHIANSLNLPDFLQETAWQIYLHVAKRKLTMGRSVIGFLSAALYAAIRIHKYPRLLEEITEVTQTCTRMVNRSLYIIIKEIFPLFGYKYAPVTPEMLVYRFGDELKISVSKQQKAIDQIRYLQRKGLNFYGKDPKGVAAASLYMVVRDTDEHRTQTEISAVSRVTEVTLRTRCKQMITFVKTSKGNKTRAA